MTTPFQDAVAEKSYKLGGKDCQCENCTIDRSIRLTIEALAEEADEKKIWATTISPVGGNTQLGFWLRSHLESSGPPMGQGPGGELPEPDIDGYTFLGRGRMHDNLPVYQKDSDSSLWIKTEGELIPYSMTFDHTNGLGRVKG